MTLANLRSLFLPCDTRLGATLSRLHGTESELRLRGAWASAQQTTRVLRWLYEGAPRPENLADPQFGSAWMSHFRASAHYTGLLIAHTGLARRLDAGAVPAGDTASHRHDDWKEE